MGLVGGATGLIGDPSGKSAERVLNPREVVAGWVERFGVRSSRSSTSSPARPAATLVNNLDWTGDLSALDFLRDIGKHFPVNGMIAREAVKARGSKAGGSATPSSATRCSRRTTSCELHQRHGCALQIGGSDQWGNLSRASDLIRRVRGCRARAGHPAGDQGGRHQVRQDRR